ncbi:MAG: molybdopterin-guanine dinucleotide biosynthesis protein B [Pseudomonadota bacterium]
MKVYGVIGWKNAGKTSLMERLVAEITGRGFTVSTVKHVHHDVDLDQPGKDTFRHRQAGATEVVLASAHRFALMHEHRGAEPDLAAVLLRLAPVDLVLVEGYKRDAHRKVEVFRRETGQSLIQPGDPLVRAVATDTDVGPVSVPVLDLNDTAAVADFVLEEVGLKPRAQDTFDTVVVVDWSASGAPSSRVEAKDAIWLGVADGSGERTIYCRTRAEAEATLIGILDAEVGMGRRVLVGFDFPIGYPAGFAERLTGQAQARAVWRWFADRITDGPDNRNNRFAVADWINRQFGGGPFWGRPVGADYSYLPTTKAVDYMALGLNERRAVETAVPRAQPVWKLYTTGSVGSQALMGLPMIHRLSQRPATTVWPFDAPSGQVVLAEVYPSLLAPAVAAEPGIKDAAQVRLLSRALLALSRAGKLGAMWSVPDGAEEEGWILGAGHADALLAACAT